MTKKNKPESVLAHLQKQASKNPAPQTPIGQARLRKLELEIRRLEHEVESARITEQERKGSLIHSDEATGLILAALASTTGWLKNLPDRYASRCNSENIEAGRRGLEAARAELSEIVKTAMAAAGKKGRKI